MKIHVKKKLTQRLWKALALKGMTNRADGVWVGRGQVQPQNQMQSDYYPQKSAT